MVFLCPPKFFKDWSDLGSQLIVQVVQFFTVRNLWVVICESMVPSYNRTSPIWSRVTFGTHNTDVVWMTTFVKILKNVKDVILRTPKANCEVGLRILLWLAKSVTNNCIKLLPSYGVIFLLIVWRLNLFWLFWLWFSPRSCYESTRWPSYSGAINSTRLFHQVPCIDMTWQCYYMIIIGFGTGSLLGILWCEWASLNQ